MESKFYQTRSNMTKQGQTVQCLVAKQCLMAFGKQTFPIWRRPKLKELG